MPAQHESQLPLNNSILTGKEDFLDESFVVKLEGQSHGLRKLLELSEDGQSCLEEIGVLRIRNIGDAAHEVKAHSIIGSLNEKRRYYKLSS